MKCKAVRHHLLASERPARPAAVVADHLAHCPACRSWQRQLARIERLVPELRLPPSNGKLDCVREVIHGTAYGRDGQRETSWQRRERALRKVAITFALAAGLLFFALVMYAWQHQRDEHWANTMPPSQPEILRLVKHYDDGKSPLWDAPPRERVTRARGARGGAGARQARPRRARRVCPPAQKLLAPSRRRCSRHRVTASRAIGQLMHRAPPRPLASSEPGKVRTSIPSWRSRWFVLTLRS